MNYEKTLNRLEEISEKMEDGKLGIDEAVKLYEEGVALTKEAYQEISAVKGKVSVLKADFDKFSKIDFEN